MRILPLVDKCCLKRRILGLPWFSAVFSERDSSRRKRVFDDCQDLQEETRLSNVVRWEAAAGWMPI